MVTHTHKHTHVKCTFKILLHRFISNLLNMRYNLYRSINMGTLKTAEGSVGSWDGAGGSVLLHFLFNKCFFIYLKPD